MIDVKKGHPTIEIKYGKLVDPACIAWSKERYPDWVPPSIDDVKKKVLVFREAWAMHEDAVLQGIADVSGLQYLRSHHDVYIVSGTPRDMSDPIIIKSRYEPDEFVYTLVHELLHRILVLNKVSNKYSTETQTVRDHIHVFAILTYVYLDILHAQERFAISRKQAIVGGEYERTWQIVEQEGYMNLIERLKNSLQSREYRNYAVESSS